MTPKLDTLKLDALFDAAIDCGTTPHGNPIVNLSLHDYDGVIVAALLAWAERHGLTVEVKTLDLPDRVWDRLKVSAPGGEIVVHDNTTTRPNTAPGAVRS